MVRKQLFSNVFFNGDGMSKSWHVAVPLRALNSKENRNAKFFKTFSK